MTKAELERLLVRYREKIDAMQGHVFSFRPYDMLK